MPRDTVASTTTRPELDDHGAPRPLSLTRDEFADEFAVAAPTLWCVAAGFTNDRAAAEDIVQQATVTALQHLDRFERSTNFVGWMARIVRNTAMNEVRKARRRNTMPIDPELLDAEAAPDRSDRSDRRFDGGPRSVAPLTPLAEIAPAQQDLDDRLLAALGRLTVDARTCLLLRVLLDLPYRQISALLDMPQGTAMSHVDRARRTLRELLGPDRTTWNGEDELDPPRRPAA